MATTSVPEALAALVEYDPGADLGENEVTMSRAVSVSRTGEVTQAVRDTVVDVGQIRKGDWIVGERGDHRDDVFTLRRGVRVARQAG